MVVPASFAAGIAVDQPTIHSSRLKLRPFALSDAAAVQQLAGEYAIADTTLTIPHPYEDGMAEQWISGHTEEFEAGTSVVFAIVERQTLELLGAISLKMDRGFNKGELGYWVGKPFWNQGYATEAARLIVDYGFNELRLNRISSRHLVRNPASGKVMRKIGMIREGTLRKDAIKWGKYEDLHLFGLLRDDWNAGKE